MRLLCGVVIAFLLMFLPAAGAFAAEKNLKSEPPAKIVTAEKDPQFDVNRERKDPEEIKRDREMAKARSKARYEQLKQDSEKLLQLATELKQYVDKTKESILSVEVIRKAEEIEKLSKSVKEKMRGE